jgi:hypothetical protein
VLPLPIPIRAPSGIQRATVSAASCFSSSNSSLDFGKRVLRFKDDVSNAPATKLLNFALKRHQLKHPNRWEGTLPSTKKEEHKHTREKERRIREAALDETLKETFPASDPPSTIPNPDEDEALEREG